MAELPAMLGEGEVPNHLRPQNRKIYHHLLTWANRQFLKVGTAFYVAQPPDVKFSATLRPSHLNVRTVVLHGIERTKGHKKG